MRQALWTGEYPSYFSPPLGDQCDATIPSSRRPLPTPTAVLASKEHRRGQPKTANYPEIKSLAWPPRRLIPSKFLWRIKYLRLPTAIVTSSSLGLLLSCQYKQWYWLGLPSMSIRLRKANGYCHSWLNSHLRAMLFFFFFFLSVVVIWLKTTFQKVINFPFKMK